MNATLHYLNRTFLSPTLAMLTRQGFIVQGKEHFEAFKKVTASSHFYDMYPSSTCAKALNWGTKGTFESLQQAIGTGWNPSSDTAKLLDISWKDSGLLIFNEKESKLEVRACMEKGVTDIQKFQDMCAYQFKMG
jgi:hypothetical protein